MTIARWEEIKKVFNAAMEKPAGERAAFVEQACGEDLELRGEVESLLLAVRPTLVSGPVQTGGAAQVMAGATATAFSMLPLTERAGTLVGPYKLLETIGEGGFGTVFLADQTAPVRRRVALKIIKLGMDTRSVIARFEAERQALALMDHPNIAKVFDGGATESGRPYFVMEYVKGDPITLFADAHRLTLRERLELLTQVCHAVQHAHQKGIIHRDIKPSNVLVSMVDGKPLAKVIDFGIAKATGAAGGTLTEKTLFTEHRTLIGTPEYMSPEQAEGSPDIDTRADVYGLGVLMYELLTGTTPFESSRLRSAAYAEMQRIIKEEEPPSPSVRMTRDVHRDLGKLASTAAQRKVEPQKLNALMRGELDWIVMKALEKDRVRRFATPQDLAADIERHLRGEAVVAAPASAAYRVRKFVRRNKGVVLVAASISVCVVLTASISTAMWIRAEREIQFREAQIRYSEMFGSGWWDVQHDALEVGKTKMREGLVGWEKLLGGGNREVVARWAQFSELMTGHGVVEEGLSAAIHGMNLRVQNFGEADPWTIGYARQAAWAAESAGNEAAREKFLKDGAERAVKFVPLGQTVRREATWDYAAWLNVNGRATEALTFMDETVRSLEQEAGIAPDLLLTAKSHLEEIRSKAAKESGG
jgi:serine/threonine protein kinase